MERASLGFPSSFAPRRPRAGRRTSRWGQAIEHVPGTRSRLTSAEPPVCVPTRSVRPRVAVVVIAVHERDPLTLVGGVAALRLVEDVCDDGGGVLDDRSGQPLVRGLRRGQHLLLGGGQHVLGGARRGRELIDSADLGDSLAVGLLPLGQAGLELRRGCCAAFAVGSLSASERITIPLPSADSTSTSSSPCSCSLAALRPGANGTPNNRTPASQARR